MKALLLLLLTLSLHAQTINIVGTWKLLSKHPISCCGLATYGTTLHLSKQGDVSVVKSKSITGTTTHYKLHGNQLNFYLANKQAGVLSNYLLKNGSTNKTFILKQTSDNCYFATQIGNHNNTFSMCKID